MTVLVQFSKVSVRKRAKRPEWLLIEQDPREKDERVSHDAKKPMSLSTSLGQLFVSEVRLMTPNNPPMFFFLNCFLTGKIRRYGKPHSDTLNTIVFHLSGRMETWLP